jgi:hypothetical protein
MPLKLLAAADLHLGRRPSRLPSELTDRIAARELGPAGAWERLVDLAVDEKVDALLLAGDVVEAEDDFFEAYAELHRGVTRLAEAGVRVFAVAGNHDTRVLPYLSDEVEAFELLGRGGEWESVHLEANGEKATLWGWSFPSASVREDPVSGFPSPEVPVQTWASSTATGIRSGVPTPLCLLAHWRPRGSTPGFLATSTLRTAFPFPDPPGIWAHSPGLIPESPAPVAPGS